jgi:predicted alpha/beta superfamily hydrolase
MGQWEDFEPPRRKDGQFVGSVRVLRGLHSPQLDNSRDIIVYLPHSYRSNGRRYPVLYMHDGQNLFYDRMSFAGAWKVDHGLADAGRAGVEAIVVAIPNMGADRLNEYSPWADPKNGGGRGDAYIRFIVDTLRPAIDAELRTAVERECTGIAGSSMGGLISLYGFLNEPTVFGFCAAMSPALWFADGRIFEYVQKAPFVPGRIYLDCGTREGKKTMDDVRRMCAALRDKGYRSPGELLCVVEAGAAHNEPAWAARMKRMLAFVLRRSSAGGELNGGNISAASADSVIRR